MIRQIGVFSADIIKHLPIDIAEDTPILLGDSNIEHMKSSHPKDYLKYGADLAKILSHPDYIGFNAKDDSIEFVKEYLVDNEYVKVAVRVSSSSQYYARSLYVLNNNRVKNFIAKGTLIKVSTLDKD